MPNVSAMAGCEC